MAYEMKNDSGSLFRNDKEGVENRPDYNGSAVINNQQFWVSGWVKHSQNGNKFLSLKFKSKEQAAPQHNPKTNKPISQHIPDADSEQLPF